MVVVLVVKNRFVRSSTCGMVGKGERPNGVAVKREVPCNEIGPLRLFGLVKVLGSESFNERKTQRSGGCQTWRAVLITASIASLPNASQLCTDADRRSVRTSRNEPDEIKGTIALLNE